MWKASVHLPTVFHIEPEIFSFFKSTYEAFFTTLDHYKAELRILLTNNFQIIGST
ncbi:hypothetical protein SAMN05428952_10162 [Nitrosomonas sp. Nm132]|nr:hypothetical protein SAMN05428952_10162 [Nitrosomonas sp. Nm132]